MTNQFNAEALHSFEMERGDDKEWPVIWFKTWQARNKWEETYFGESEMNVITRINDLNDLMQAGELEEKEGHEEGTEFKGMQKLQPRSVKKQPGRNDECHCGSGKKFKKCCMLKLMN